MRVAIARVDPSLPLPEYQTPGAAGFDFLCRHNVTIAAHSLAVLPSNIILTVPEGHVLVVTLRSSTPRRKGLMIPHGIGIIDQDYHGPQDEILIQVYNFTDEEVLVSRGERIAQGLLLPIAHCEWTESDSGMGQSRGGFGSTG